MVTRTKLTSKEIEQIVDDYHAALRDWQKVGGDTLVRTEELIGQSIWFDRLRTGAYRPTMRVHVFVAPDEGGGTVVLPQFLGIKTKEVSVKAHLRQFPAVMDALKNEVVPSIEKALNAEKVTTLLRSRAAGRPVGAYALACLFGAMERAEDARQWMIEYQKAFESLGLPEQPSDNARFKFLARLERWLNNGTSRCELAKIAKSEKMKFLNSF
jgi:hypothetical protein